jgi:hypothetical protein
MALPTLFTPLFPLLTPPEGIVLAVTMLVGPPLIVEVAPVMMVGNSVVDAWVPAVLPTDLQKYSELQSCQYRDMSVGSAVWMYSTQVSTASSNQSGIQTVLLKHKHRAWSVGAMVLKPGLTELQYVSAYATLEHALFVTWNCVVASVTGF